ncbi:tyrosine-protein phosphatase non-receptor type 2-like [Liolophura sinensis]|uniref:tyrosine-protein phosphatase non-receptor type 2-like n=1 Tax=Liolophura sinensis TaxID=3198878 RepID=UPI003158A82F
MALVEKELEEYDSAGSWPVVFQRIKNESSINHTDFSIKEARKPENRTRNRYRDVSPYDHSRVVLGKGGNDYINASLIEATEANRRYILTQGPLEHTSGHFWQMIWEQKSKGVIMLNKIVEKGSPKCHQYWPLGPKYSDEDTLVFNDTGIKVTLLEENELNYFVVSTLELEDLETNETRHVLHFHYVTWPDFGVPQSPSAFLNFLIAVRESGSLDTDVGPAVIHCSAGIGRSGTFCLVDTCLVMLEKTRDLNSINVREVLIKMRSYRMGLIQTPDQLRFSYLAVIEGARRILYADDFSKIENNNEDSPRNATPSSAHSSLSDLSETDDRDGEPPPLPPRRSSRPADEDNMETRSGDGDNDVSEQDSGYGVRRRLREERKKKTIDQLEKMKKKQKESERWRRRRPYMKPIVIGLLILAGGYLLYRWYW